MGQLFAVIEKNCKNLKRKFPKARVELVLVNDSPTMRINVPQEPTEFKYSIINHAENAGIHQARVTGLQNSKGDYILFLDQDDVLEENALASQMCCLMQNDADMVVCNAYMENSNGSVYKLYKTRTELKLLNDLQFYLKSHNLIKSPGQCILKKSCIPQEWQRYIMKKNGSDDLFLWILLFEQSHRFTINNDILYIHKYTGENLSDSEQEMCESSLEIVDYLNNVEYVTKEHIKLLKRSREYEVRQYHAGKAGKILVALQNLDLIIYLAATKIRRVLF